MNKDGNVGKARHVKGIHAHVNRHLITKKKLNFFNLPFSFDKIDEVEFVAGEEEDMVEMCAYPLIVFALMVTESY